MSDLYQMSVINEVWKQKLKENEGTGNLWKCFALVCLKGMKLKDKISIINYYQSKGIYLIFEDDYSKLPGTLSRLL